MLLALPALFAVVTLVLHSTCFVESPTWLQNGPRRDADAAQQARKRLGLLSYLDHDSTSGSSTIPAGSRFDGSGPDDEVGKDGASSAVELLLRSKDEEEGGDDGNDISGDDSDNAGLQSGHNLHSDHRRRNTNSTSADAASSAGSTSSSAHNRSGSSTGSESESLSLSEVWADARLRLPSMVLTALLVGQQLSGINAVNERDLKCATLSCLGMECINFACDWSVILRRLCSSSFIVRVFENRCHSIPSLHHLNSQLTTYQTITVIPIYTDNNNYYYHCTSIFRCFITPPISSPQLALKTLP